MDSERRPPRGGRRDGWHASRRDCQPASQQGNRRGRSDRAVSPVVGKALEASIVVLYIGLLSSTLYGGVVPDYRTAAGAEVGERVLAQSAERVQQAVPTDARAVRVRTEISLPRTIRGETYAVRTDERALVLDHPADRVSGRVALALPETVTSVSGNWSSRESAFVIVRNEETGGLAVRLESGGERGPGGERV
ncbi:DUF7266 family protein [Halorussus pelagicus]|uniref:DUF7266 family protein n=1 Tax=Halorussus pelagicus TaxID=2505977 RepID=UPI001AA08F47|nr:hypothetical protein [Halorussus pelagicus]